MFVSRQNIEGVSELLFENVGLMQPSSAVQRTTGSLAHLYIFSAYSAFMETAHSILMCT